MLSLEPTHDMHSSGAANMTALTEYNINSLVGRTAVHDTWSQLIHTDAPMHTWQL